VIIYDDDRQQFDVRLTGDELDQINTACTETSWVYSIEEMNPSEPRLLRLLRDKQICPLLIIRDPYNCFASQIVSGKISCDELSFKLQLCKRHFAWALTDPPRTANPLRVVSFNRFVVDFKYREELARYLGMSDLNYAEGAFDIVPDFGGGSSFTGTTPSSNHQRQVFERWQSVVGDPLFEQVCADRELHNMAEQIFGMQPGCRSREDGENVKLR